MILLFKNCTILPMTASKDEPKTIFGSVGIVGNRIAMVSADEHVVSEFCQANPGVRVIDATGKVLMPGLINTHCHVSMTLQRGYADDIALMSWLHDYVWPFEAVQSVDDIAVGAKLGVVEMLLGGVTSFVDMYWHEDRIYDVVDELGIRALLGCSCLDGNMSEFERSLKAGVEKSRGNDRIKMAVAPHAPYTCSPETFKRAISLAKEHGLHFMTHIAETKDEISIMKERYGQSPVEYLDSVGALTDKTIGAHCVHVSSSDIAILKERGVSIAHNPQSNMKVSSGTAPIEKMRVEGLVCTIATDGPCSNNDLDMWEEMRSASFLQKLTAENPCVMPAYEVLKMVTVQGAKAIGHGGELGIIAQGALADIILIDICKVHLQPMHDIIANLVYCGKASDVDTVVVDGNLIVENRKMVNVDVMQLIADVNVAVKGVLSRR